MRELLPAAGPVNLEQLKSQGKKLIGYVPNGYLPEELIHACGAVPVALVRGGDPAPVAASITCLARFLDPFCRAQIGYRLLDEELAYQLLDMLAVPVTDNHVRAIADSWDFYTGVEVFRFGVPHIKADHGYEYYLEGLNLLRQRLEDFTGNEVTDAALRAEIDLSNEIRELLNEISGLRKAGSPLISGREFIALNHRSLFADRRELPAALRDLLSKLKSAEADASPGPRVLLAGSTLALGDDKVVELLEESGAAIVAEEFSEGMRQYRQTVAAGDDPMRCLADACFADRVSDAFFRGAARERIEYILKLAQEFKADGIVWYTLMYRDSYNVEGHILHKALEERGLPLLRISSDYDEMETGGFRTRIETFVSTLREE